MNELFGKRLAIGLINDVEYEDCVLIKIEENGLLFKDFESKLFIYVPFSVLFYIEEVKK